MEPNVGAARPHWSRWAAVEMTRSADGAGVSDALNEAAAGGSRARAAAAALLEAVCVTIITTVQPPRNLHHGTAV